MQKLPLKQSTEERKMIAEFNLILNSN